MYTDVFQCSSPWSFWKRCCNWPLHREATGDRLREAQHINRSLSALADVVVAKARAVTSQPKLFVVSRWVDIEKQPQKNTWSMSVCVQKNQSALPAVNQPASQSVLQFLLHIFPIQVPQGSYIDLKWFECILYLLAYHVWSSSRRREFRMCRTGTRSSPICCRTEWTSWTPESWVKVALTLWWFSIEDHRFQCL